MDVLLQSTALLAFVLLLSFIVERLMEIIKALYYLLDSAFHFHSFYSNQAIKLKIKLEKILADYEFADPKLIAKALNAFKDYISDDEEDQNTTIPVVSGNLVRTMYVKVASKILAITFGICLASCFEVDLLELWYQSGGVWGKTIMADKYEWIRLALTGLLLGFGTTPVHKVIVAIEKKRGENSPKEVGNV